MQNIIASKEPEESSRSTVILEYYQAVFLRLHKVHRKSVSERFKKRLEFRREHFLSKLPKEETLSGEFAWSFCNAYLGCLEQELKRVLVRHSVYFWIHLYRRLGVALVHESGPKIDANTLGLVRQIVELAISKFGAIGQVGDIVRVSQVKAKDILGGHYQRIGRQAYRSRYDEFYKALKATAQNVVTRFEVRDFLDLYYLEAIAYDYWRTTALMRAIGKGAGFSFEGDDWVKNVATNEFRVLIRSYDERIKRVYANSALAGTWFSNKKADNEGGALVVPFYNIEQALGAKDFKFFKIDVPKDFIPNFRLGFLDFVGFRNANAFLAEPFAKHYGCSFDAYVTALWGLAYVSNQGVAELLEQSSPDEALAANSKGYRTLHTLFQRGYFPYAGDAKTLATTAVAGVRGFGLPFSNVSVDEVLSALSRLTLNEGGRDKIGLWSGGPRFPLVTHGPDQILIDLQGLPIIKQTLFVGVQHKPHGRGTVFEEAFRAGVVDRGYSLEIVGVITAADGSEREVDASVRVGETLVLLECLSSERPLDFEIGRIRTFNKRQHIFQEKLTQADTLAQFFKDKPRGRNYDVTWATNIVSCVVSPFHEWIWDRSAILWVDLRTPRILQADEAIDYLDRLRELETIRAKKASGV